MPSSEAPISINLKTPAGTQITLRAETPDEFTQITSAIFQIVEAVGEVETAVRGANAAVPPNPQVASIATSFGATNVVTQPAPFVPSAFANVTDGQRVCPHGTMTRIHGLTGKFGPYKGHFCPAKQGDATKCTTQYIKANQPEWNAFQADQTKA
jgi:hypothetical protein